MEGGAKVWLPCAGQVSSRYIWGRCCLQLSCSLLIAQCAHAAPDPSVLSTWWLSFKLPIRTLTQSYEVRQGNGPIQLQYWPSLGTTSIPFRNVKRHFCRCKNPDALLLLNQLSTLHTKRLNLVRKLRKQLGTSLLRQLSSLTFVTTCISAEWKVEGYKPQRCLH